MGEIVKSISIAGYIGLGIMVGPIFALLLYHLAEKRWGNGTSWAWIGMFTNVFGLLFFLLLAGFETSEARSIGAMETQRMRKLVQATKGIHSFERQLIDNPNMEVQQKLITDERIDSLLANHEPAEALALARERRAVAFQLGDTEREDLYGRYIEEIETEDAQRRILLQGLEGGGAIK